MGAWWWTRSCSDRTHWKLPPGGHLVDRTPWGCAENTEPSAERFGFLVRAIAVDSCVSFIQLDSLYNI